MKYLEYVNLRTERKRLTGNQKVLTTILDLLRPDNMRVVISRIRYNTGYASNQVRIGFHSTCRFPFDRI